MNALFGPAGNSDSFKEKGYKSYADIVQYVVEMGLDTYEYQCGHGVRISQDAATRFGELAKAAGIVLSLHAPYYISLSSVEEEKRQNSVDYIVSSARAAHSMGADRIVVHSGSCGKLTRADALELAKDTLSKAVAEVDRLGFSDVRICPETMGKVNQLGTLEEVLALCGIDERMLPCIDFGHLNARTFGGMSTYEAFDEVLEKIENALGRERAKQFHAHFSKIEYSQNGGEKRHLTFADDVYGPDFTLLAQAMAKRDSSPRIICESAGTQAEDALQMKQDYFELRGECGR